MKSPLHILHLEDSPEDAELIRDILETDGIVSHVTRVETQADFLTSLEHGRFDLILADYSLPSFDGLSALKLALEKYPNIPFIFVSATLGEEVAIEALKLGATDYVLKDRLSRIVPSVQRALREAEERNQRKRAEEALRQSEEQWRDIFEHNPTMYFIVDPAGIVLSVNPFGAEQLGYTVDELIGDSVLKVIYEPDREAAKEKVALCLEQPGRSMSWELRKIRKNGTMLWVRETARAVRRANGPIVLVACEDITERKQAQEALHKAQAELAHVTRVLTIGELTASIAHEVNQPLSGIVTNANACRRWLAGATPNLDEARDAVGRILRDGNRASDVITRIRALVRKSDTEKAQLDINQIVQEVVALMQNESVRQGAALRMELAANVPPVLGDRVQVQQVILNLMMNGIEAMGAVTDRSRELLIKSVQHESDQVLVAVQDSGIGIDRENLEKVFTSFYTTKSQGMGMGLAICRSIVENHGGRLWAVSNDGPGATFQFTLPRYH